MTAAEVYERFLVPAIFGPWAEVVIAVSPPSPGATVLDVACGTGIGARVASRLVGPSGRVVGLDADEGMLVMARFVTRGDGGAPIAWQRGNALDLPLAGGAFDHVVCLEGIQFFPDREAGLREVRRVMRPDGTLVASVWAALEQNPGYHALSEGLRAFVSDAAGRLPPFALGDPDAVRALMAAAGFTASTVETHRLAIVAPSVQDFVTWVATGAPTTRHNLGLLAPDDRAAFDAFVASRLAPYRTEGRLTLPSARNVVVARR
jgi:SAM-dependent methyltransferase